MKKLQAVNDDQKISSTDNIILEDKRQKCLKYALKKMKFNKIRQIDKGDSDNKKCQICDSETFLYTFELVMEWVALFDFITDL